MPGKRITVCLLIFILAVSLSSCNKAGEYGTIEDAAVSIAEESSEGCSIFERQELPFEDYELSSVDFESALLRFDVPKAWQQTIYNMSCIRYDSPSDDPHFPGATFYVKCNFDYNAGSDELDPFSTAASEFGKPMSSYITGLPFTCNGRDAWIKSFAAADESFAPSFCPDETAASIKITRDVILINKQTGDAVSLGGMDFVAGYFKWEGFPVMIATVVPSSASGDAKTMIGYMISASKYLPQRVSAFTERTCSDIAFELPGDFSPFSKAGNIFISPASDIKACSGTSAGVFRIEESLDMLSPDYFNASYAGSVAEMLLDPICSRYYSASASMQEDPEVLVPDEKRHFSGTVNILTDEEDHVSARMTYGTVGVWQLSCFVAEKGGALYLVAVMYPQQSDAAARIVAKGMLQSLRKR